VKTFVYPSDRGPCGHNRLIWPAKALKAQGHDIEIADHRFAHENLIRVDADVVVMQRPITTAALGEIQALRARGVAVVVDMDDDLSCVHPRNPASTNITPLHQNAIEACNAATLVTVTTKALAKRYGPGVVIPNFVPEAYLRTPHRDSNTVGWAGDIKTHPADLQVMGDSIARLEKRRSMRFYAVGPGAGVARALGLMDEVYSSGTVSLGQWPSAVSRIGIGVAPLEDSPFNHAKSRLKPLEYSAVGVPWVASPTPDYVALHELGAGLLADGPDEWHKHLIALSRDPNMRGELADAGRAVAREQTIELNAWRFAEAWASAASKEKRKR
jgi:glycosyltransferase involved in cell wall biosynthesis